MVMSGMKYSGSYGAIFFGTISTHDPPFDKDTAVAFSVAHTALHCSSEKNNYRTTNGRTSKESVIMHWVFEQVLTVDIV